MHWGTKQLLHAVPVLVRVGHFAGGAQGAVEVTVVVLTRVAVAVDVIVWRTVAVDVDTRRDVDTDVETDVTVAVETETSVLVTAAQILLVRPRIVVGVRVMACPTTPLRRVNNLEGGFCAEGLTLQNNIERLN